MVALTENASKRVPSRTGMRWFEVLRSKYVWLRDWMPAIGNLAPSGQARAHREGPWRLHAGRRFDGAVAAQRLAESYHQRGELIFAVGVLTDAAAQFSQGRFPATAVELIRRIIQDDRNASALRAVAETCLKHGEPKHLVAAVCLLGMAHSHDPADRQALELLVRAFEKMGLAEKARRVEEFIAETLEEAPSLPALAL